MPVCTNILICFGIVYESLSEAECRLKILRGLRGYRIVYTVAFGTCPTLGANNQVPCGSLMDEGKVEMNGVCVVVK